MHKTTDHDTRSSAGEPQGNDHYDRADTRAGVGTDRDVADYLRSPYDPLFTARIGGKVAGQMLRRLWRRLARRR